MGGVQIGCAFDEALAVIDMATLLHPTDADSLAEIGWARETLTRLAREALSRSPRGSRRDRATSRQPGDPLGVGAGEGCVGMKLEVMVGDLTTASVEAIVNAANSDLDMGAGIAGAIKRTAGDEVEAEAIAQGPINPGVLGRDSGRRAQSPDQVGHPRGDDGDGSTNV